MLAVFLSIAPIFALIVLGHVLRRGGIPSADFWSIADRLVYWVLFPALLFNKTSTINLSGELLGTYAIVIWGGFGAAIVFALLAGRGLALGGPVASSVLQGAARHNTFIALAVAERVFGGEGLALAALATSLLIPVTNLVVVTCMVALLRREEDGNVAAMLARDLARNPLIIAVLLGLSANIIGAGDIPVIHDATDILGRATLPVVLLCIGASIQLRDIRTALLPLLVSTAGKLLIFPMVIFALLLATGLQGLAAVVAVIYGAVPTATTGYTLARQMGGDASLMANIITLQTLISMLSMPLTIVLAQKIFG